MVRLYNSDFFRINKTSAQFTQAVIYVPRKQTLSRRLMQFSKEGSLLELRKEKFNYDAQLLLAFYQHGWNFNLISSPQTRSCPSSPTQCKLKLFLVIPLITTIWQVSLCEPYKYQRHSKYALRSNAVALLLQLWGAQVSYFAPVYLLSHNTLHAFCQFLQAQSEMVPQIRLLLFQSTLFTFRYSETILLYDDVLSECSWTICTGIKRSNTALVSLHPPPSIVFKSYAF